MFRHITRLSSNLRCVQNLPVQQCTSAADLLLTTRPYSNKSSYKDPKDEWCFVEEFCYGNVLTMTNEPGVELEGDSKKMNLAMLHAEANFSEQELKKFRRKIELSGVAEVKIVDDEFFADNDDDEEMEAIVMNLDDDDDLDELLEMATDDDEKFAKLEKELKRKKDKIASDKTKDELLAELDKLLESLNAQAETIGTKKDENEIKKSFIMEADENIDDSKAQSSLDNMACRQKDLENTDKNSKNLESKKSIFTLEGREANRRYSWKFHCKDKKQSEKRKTKLEKLKKLNKKKGDSETKN